MKTEKTHKKRKQAEIYVTDLFCEQRGVDASGLSTGLKHVLAAAHLPFILFCESCDSPQIRGNSNPLYHLLITMTHRSFESVNSCLGLVAQGQLQGAEVVARSVVEHSITTLYVLQDDTANRLLQYFHAYIDQERKQNRNWAKALKGSPEQEIEDNRRRIENKNNVLHDYEIYLQHFSSSMGLNYPPKNYWPAHLDQIFRALEKELEYRTVYAALCSQSHHDAEDLLNRFIVDNVDDIEYESLSMRVRSEKHTFSLLMIVTAIQYFVQKMLHIGEYFSLNPVVEESNYSEKLLMKEAAHISQCLDEGTFPKEWKGRLMDGI